MRIDKLIIGFFVVTGFFLAIAGFLVISHYRKQKQINKEMKGQNDNYFI